MNLLAELKRRNVFRVGIAYLVVSWLLLQVADVMIDNIGAPDWLFQAILLVLALGFVIAVVFSWAFEMTPEGLKRDGEVKASDSIAQQTGRKLDRAIIVILVISLAYFVWESRIAGKDEIKTAAETAAMLGEPAEQIPATAPAEEPVAMAKSVAVLPFMNMSSDPEQEYFSDGITEEVINALVKVPGLSVPARTSVFAFKGRLQDVREIGRELNVAHVLEGSIRSQGKQVRITAQLINVESGYHLWSETFDRQLENIFAVQEEIAGAISQVLVGELGVDVDTVTNQTRDMEAYDLYLQGRAALRKRQPVAVKLFAAVTQQDPDFAPGWAALAMAYNSVSDDNEAAIQSAEKALSMDPDNVDALNAMGASLRELSRWNEAERYLDQALAIDPSSAELLEDYAEFLNFVGRTEEALEVTTRAMAIEPGLLPLQQEHVAALLAEGQVDEARIVAEQMTQVASDRGWYRQMMGWMLQQIIDADLEPATTQPLEFEGDESELPPIVVEFANLLKADDLMTPEWGLRLKDFVENNLADEYTRYFYWMSRVALVKTGHIDFVFDMDIEMQRVSFEWMWVPAMAPFRQHDRFAVFLETTDLSGYWDATAWPRWCRRHSEGVISCQ